jgi:hypothetical protein
MNVLTYPFEYRYPATRPVLTIDPRPAINLKLLPIAAAFPVMVNVALDAANAPPTGAFMDTPVAIKLPRAIVILRVALKEVAFPVFV